jgi:hypothetical protein
MSPLVPSENGDIEMSDDSKPGKSKGKKIRKGMSPRYYEIRQPNNLV